MRIVDFSLRRRVTVAMCAVALLLFGAVAVTRLPLNLMPDLSYPSLTVETRLPGAAPAEVEALVSRPIEEVVGVVNGVQRLTSVSKPGLSQVTLELGWGRNMDFAALDVRQKLDLITLPRDASKPIVLRFDPANDPILRLYLTASGDPEVTADAGTSEDDAGSEAAVAGGLSGEDRLYQLRYVAEELVKKDLESTEGVAAIKVHGGYEEEIEVRINEDQLALRGLTIDEVNSRLLRENLNQAGGSLYEEEARYLVRARNEFRNLDDIRATVLLTREGRRITVGDVATVNRSHKQREVITRYAGAEAVELAIYKEGDANIVGVARSVMNRLEAIKKELPGGVAIEVGADQSRFIRASVDEVLMNAVVGGLIAMAVLLLFLRDLRSTLIIGVSIPVSVMTTFLLMKMTDTTLNIMSLGGLALGVGMLVDSAIVVLEAIVKRREAGEEIGTAAGAGASEVGMAVVASTLTTVSVFVPVIFLQGIAAQLFRDQALTVSFSLLAALAVALTIIPMMAAVIGREPVAAPPEPSGGSRTRRIGRSVLVTAPTRVLSPLRLVLGGLLTVLALPGRPIAALCNRLFDRLHNAYPGMLESALRHRFLILLVALAAFGGSVSLVPRLGIDLIPPFAQGEFSFRVELPEGTPLPVTDRFIAGVAEALEGEQLIESYSTIAGGAGLSLASTGTEGENTGRIQVRMATGTSPEQEELVIARLRQGLEGTEQVSFKLERATFFSFRTPIEVEVPCEDLEQLHASAAQVEQALIDIPGLVDVKSSAEIGNPEVQVRFDRNQLALFGLSLAEVAQTVRTKIQGEVATRFTEGDREIDIRVRALGQGSARVEDINQLIVAHRDGRPIYLETVADIAVTEGPTEIRRVGQRRTAIVSGNLQGRDMGAVAADVKAAIASLPLPSTVRPVLSGQEEELNRSFESLGLAMGLAIFLVYLVMASQFESFLHPFVIIFTLPLGAIGVIVALAVTGNTINVVAIIGSVMLAGIVVNNAIVLIDAVNQRRREGMDVLPALKDAGQSRLRPIIMTSATTIFGLLPMALGLGEGAELRAPLAITVIGGLSVATALTLIVIPVVYSLLSRGALVMVDEPAEEPRYASESTEPLAVPVAAE